MTLVELAGRTYGPFPYTIERTKIAEFVTATSDDPDRWTDHAPPGFAACLLFSAAPAFFADPVATPYTRILLHTEQRFVWHRALEAGSALSITGRVDGVRQRAGLNLVTFEVAATGDGTPVLDSRSTFMMSDAAPATDDVEEPEPAADIAPGADPVSFVPLPGVGNALPDLAKSASRADLVRYAGATLDFNPIHWDHAAARKAGLGGVVVHGLLMVCWMVQAAGRVSKGPVPLHELRARFRTPLRPGTAAIVAGAVESVTNDRATIRCRVSSAGSDIVVGTAIVPA